MQLNFVHDLAHPDLSRFLQKAGLLSQEGVLSFQKTVYDYYAKSGRNFAWRSTTDPYKIVVSEIMLQQTQTDRVKEKYAQFIAAFPSFLALAEASVAAVISQWQGLGYNRRALALQACAQRVVTEYNGLLPNDPEKLVQFKGIGKATAASICAFAFNRPTVFIETNIRTVYIHTFFREQQEVADTQLMPLIEQTVDLLEPRIWYYALMDYGVMLKKLFPNPSRKSKHYAKQSRFEGSDRQIRGLIIKLLTSNSTSKLSFADLCIAIPRESQRIESALKELIKEGFIREKDAAFLLAC